MSSSVRDTLLILLALLLMGLLARAALAQVPPHYPGTICYTQTFWCWAQPPGPPNTPCGCPSRRGMVPGVRG